MKLFIKIATCVKIIIMSTLTLRLYQPWSVAGPQVWGIYIILKGTGIEGFIFSQLLTAKGRKHSRLSWQTVLVFVPKAIVLHLGWPGLPGKSGLCDVLLMAFGIPVMHWSGR